MNAASIEKSERLGRVLDLLSRGGEFSTLDIIKKANVCAVNSIVAELRQNGFEISCQRCGDKWFYRLEK
jgi:DNA-directed RNA polymerase subunit RPC12/RpoP